MESDHILSPLRPCVVGIEAAIKHRDPVGPSNRVILIRN